MSAPRWCEGSVHGWTVYEGKSPDDCEEIGSAMTEQAARELVAFPDLLKALNELQRINDEDVRGNRPEGRVAAWAAARAAIALARGGK